MWVRTGNVNVVNGNATVNGGSSAPNFITNGVEPGYIFRGPGAATYEVLAVVSETQLTLQKVYAGSTASNQSYEIIQLSAAAYAEVLAQVIALITLLKTSISLTTLNVGSPTATGAVAAFLGTLFSYEATASGKARFSKGANANDIILELAVGLSGRARIGLIGDNNIKIDYSADGSSWTNAVTIDVTNGRLTLNTLFFPDSYAVGSLPTSVAGGIIHVSDLGGGVGPIVGDGTGWQRMTDGYATVSSNADFTLQALVNANQIRHTGTLTANRAVTLSTTGARAGARFRITRTGSGAFNLAIGTGPLKNLVQNTWCEVIFDGTAWYLSAYGAL